MSDNIDTLGLYFGNDYKINKYITVHNPTIGDVIEVGEEKYFHTLSLLTAIPSDMKAMLWDSGINWMEISDFDFFCLISRALTPKDTGIFLGDLDLSKMQLGTDCNTKETVLYQLIDEDNAIIIDKTIYKMIVNCLRKIHGIVPKVEIAGTKTLTKILVELNRSDIKKASEKPFSSSLLPLISTMLNMEGFNYTLQQIRELPYYAFMDAVKRTSLIKSTTALLNGCYSGWIDGSKIDKKNLNYFKDLEGKENKKPELTENS